MDTNSNPLYRKFTSHFGQLRDYWLTRDNTLLALYYIRVLADAKLLTDVRRLKPLSPEQIMLQACISSGSKVDVVFGYKITWKGYDIVFKECLLFKIDGQYVNSWPDLLDIHYISVLEMCYEEYRSLYNEYNGDLSHVLYDCMTIIN